MNNNLKKQNQFRAYLAITWYSFRAQTRNVATFFFGFLFPIVFIGVFGLIGNSSSKVTIGIPINSNQNNFVVKSIQKQSFVTVNKGSVANLETQLKTGKIGGIVTVVPSGKKYQVNVQTSTANPVDAASITSFLRGEVDQANLRMSGISNPPISLDESTVSGRQFRYIDFALPGMIGFSLLSTAVFGTVFGLIFLKKSLVVKRMFATPMQPLTFLLAQGTSRLIIAVIQTVVILVIGVFVFRFYLPQGIITFIELIILSSLGLTAFLGFGYFTAGLVNDENAANPLVNLITLPQFLLAGTFFPIDNLPRWVAPVANNLPLTYFNDAVRKITTEGGSFQETLPYMAGLIAWGLVMYVLAARTFKWE